MKSKILVLFLTGCLLLSLTACGGTTSPRGSDEEIGNSSVSSSQSTSEVSTTSSSDDGPEGFNAEGLPIVDEPITVDTWVEGGTDIDWSKNAIVNQIAEESNIKMEISAVASADSVTQRNLRFASGDLPELLLMDWTSMLLKNDVMNYGVKEGILLPINDYVDKYGVRLKEIFEEYPQYKEMCTAPDGKIYGFARFQECYHCQAYPKIYLRQDWLDALDLEMPTNTDEFKEVLTAFKTQDPNGNGEADEIAFLGASDRDSMVEYAIIGMSFQTVVPDFWLSLGEDGETIEFSPSTDAYREGLLYLKDLFDSGLIDPTSFSQDTEQMSQTVRLEPHVVGAYACDHVSAGLDSSDPVEAKNYQIMPPISGPSGFQRQGQNGDDGEIMGFHAAITTACENPEAVFRMVDHYFYDDDLNMSRLYGPQGIGWDYAEEGTKDVFGGDAKYVVLKVDDDTKAEEVSPNLFTMGPQADLEAFRLSMLPQVEGDEVYEPENYEQRITLDTEKCVEYIPEERLQYHVYVPIESADDYSEIQTNLNSFVRSATAQFIMGDRDPSSDSDWETYLSELDSYRVNEYIEIYKAAIEQE